jgi:hypothetical protein
MFDPFAALATEALLFGSFDEMNETSFEAQRDSYWLLVSRGLQKVSAGRLLDVPIIQ